MSYEEQILALQIPGADEAARAEAHERWNAVAKPIGSLGLLETDIERIAACTGSADIDIAKRAVVVMCADNGVVEEGVTQAGQEVTALVAENMARAQSSVCRMGAVVGAKVFPVNVGMVHPAPTVRDCKVMSGTNNMTKGPAMSREQAAQAIWTGVEVVRELVAQGYCMFATGEMGIGNTTSSSALASVLLGMAPDEVTGKGAGLSDEGLARKVQAIKRAINVNKPNPSDPLDVLSKVGGLDIAGLVGVYLGCAEARVPVVIDGFISAVAALTAIRMFPKAKDAMLSSHASAEPAVKAVLVAIGLRAPIHADMRLGEGTGAVCLFPLLDMALRVYDGTSFDGLGIDAYDADLVK